MNNQCPRLVDLPHKVKLFLSAFLILMTIGVTIGLVYVNQTTGMSGQGTTDHYAGSQVEDDMDIPEKYPKEIESMLLTTHTHLISFAFIFFFLGGIFYMNSTITGGWKTLIMVEPFISVLGTFGSIWGVRYGADFWSLATMIFGIMTYTTYYGMVFVCLFDLLIKKESK